MSKPFVCTGCRVRLAIRPRRSAGRDLGLQHRDFSQSITHNQTDPTVRSIGHIAKQREDIRRRRIYEEGVAEIGRGRPERSVGGRYYGQPLKPQHLLQELDEPQRPAQGRRQKIRRLIHPEVNDQSLLSRSVGAMVIKFRGHVLRSELAAAWDTLNQLRTISLDTSNVDISPRPETMKRLHQLMRRIVGDFTRNLGAKDLGQSGTSLPSPWEFVQVARDLGLLVPALRAELLWRLGNALAMKMQHDSELGQKEQYVAFHQLTLIWHDTLRSKLQPKSISEDQFSAKSSMQWSFLPSLESILKTSSGPHLRFDEILSTILPIDKFNTILETHADYQSALFVTLDLLKREALEAISDSADSRMHNQPWEPMVDFFKNVLSQVDKPDVPPAIRMRLTQAEDPTLSYYEAMIRRFDLANIPPIRTDRSKATSDERHSMKQRAELGLQQKKEAEPPLKQEAVIQPDLRATETTSLGGAVPAMGLATALDRESLLKAGFSVSELFSMDREVHRLVLKWTRLLGRSIETSNLLRAEQCWKEVRRYNSERPGPTSLPLFLYEHFMLTFLALRQPRLAVETWTTVLEAGLQPTVKSWTVMMRGCARANDPDTMERFWMQMRDQGVQPDRHAWSVRLFCLIKAERINKAFSGLQAMGQEWIAAVRAKQRSAITGAAKKELAAVKLPEIDLTQWTDDVNGVPRPSLVVLNSVISSLANKSDEHIPRALAWGRDFAIDLDLTTFNALLNVAMRHGQTEKAFSILQHMKTRSIKPNSTTITVVLTALFQSDYFTHLLPEEQTEKLFTMISVIESSSPTARLDAKGYALAIDRMLRHENPAAARALLEHMSARGLQPTTHIYTILMSSYFNADPPDFDAAEALWSRLQSENAGHGAALDTIFYDRMVEGYARHHAHVGIAPMMQFLERMSIEGKRPGWPMLESVARALVERDEWGMLHGLVDDIRYSKGMVRVGVRGLVGQNEFWRYILSTGVLNRDGITSEQQLRKGWGESSFAASLPGFDRP